MLLDLTDDEAAVLARLLQHIIDDDRYPFLPRLAPLKAILTKLEPPQARTSTIGTRGGMMRRPLLPSVGAADERLSRTADDG
jgi:hypothetical protein